MQKNILVTGSHGQLGSELVERLTGIYGADHIIASDIKPSLSQNNVTHEILDVMNADALGNLIKKHNIGQIYHLAATLSAVGEQKPLMAWSLNMQGLLNVLEVASQQEIEKIFWPSSIGAFGSTTPANNTPQQTIMEPDTVYGISKLAGEGWCRWYRLNRGLDIRSLRYPGLISHSAPPGGGTTDYAIDIFHAALAGETYVCPLEPDTALPMMYMPDALRATLKLMEADLSKVKIPASYNLTAMSFTPAQLADEIRAHIPQFQIIYAPDYRQNIAAHWPNSLDDSAARRDWGWRQEFNLSAMVADMLEHFRAKSGHRFCARQNA